MLLIYLKPLDYITLIVIEIVHDFYVVPFF
jgi:hypothetical protein